jgi:uncharacterized protein (DUF1778 family)
MRRSKSSSSRQSAASRKAIVAEEAIIRLNRAQAKRVFELLDNPPKPSPALLAAKALYRKLVRD